MVGDQWSDKHRIRLAGCGVFVWRPEAGDCDNGRRGDDTIFLPFIAATVGGLALLLAALTFAVAANVGVLQRFAVPGPIAAAILTPSLLLIAAPFELPMDAHPSWWIYALAVGLFATVSAVAAKIAALLCGALFEFVPILLDRQSRIRPELPLQLTILCGGALSLLVNAAFFVWLTNMLRENMKWATCSAVVGVVTTGACIRALSRLSRPHPFQPRPLPEWVKRLIFRSRASEGHGSA